MRQNPYEKGQAIVLLVFLLIGLIAITALAVDGGLLYQSRRNTQNGADNAALAGAQAICYGENVSSKALASASANGFNDDGVANTVTVSHPPVSGPFAGNSAYVEVVITSQQTPAFVRLIYAGAFETSARAVGHCQDTPAQVLGGGAGLLVLNPSAGSAFKGSGTNTVTVSGGVFVNSNSSSALNLSGSARLTSDTINIVGLYSGSPSSISPTPTTGATAITDPIAALAAPATPGGSCAAQPAGSSINPGYYCSINVSPSATLTMNPGNYFISGDFTSKGTLIGNGVMIYARSGKVTLSGTIKLSAATYGTYKGLLLFMGRSNSNDMALTAGGSSTVTGTLYGSAATIKLTGSSSTFVFNSQVIGDQVTVSGTADLNIQYNPLNNFLFDSGSRFVELAE